MQALIELLAGFIALLVSAALSQFGVDVTSPPKAPREVHRIADCRESPNTDAPASTSHRC